MTNSFENAISDHEAFICIFITASAHGDRIEIY